MKNNYLKRIAIVLLINSILFLVYIHFSNINLLEISGNKDVNYYPYLRLVISVIFSIFILLIFIKEYKINIVLNLLWLIPVFYVFFSYVFGIYNIQKTDNFLAKKVNQFDVNQYQDRGWTISRFIIKNNHNTDTLYLSINPSWKSVYTVKELQNAKLSKSWITGYYYVSLK